MLGWGMFLAFMVFYAFKKREPWSWVCISLGLGLWFMLDTAVSAWCRVALNVLFNAVLLLAVRRAFFKA
ncbi:MAG TPA: hypothetical protein PKW33_17345 [Anaerolineaceae bacterium]|nr:hypothetical protein [Anaerolineaceae bacterium]HPN53366.1 hypothetical protein [Anaerolineaceae bacterium]